MLMMTKSLLDENQNPTEEEIRFALSGNLCRCTGYAKIIQAVQIAAAELRKDEAGKENGRTCSRRKIGDAHRRRGESHRPDGLWIRSRPSRHALWKGAVQHAATRHHQAYQH